VCHSRRADAAGHRDVTACLRERLLSGDRVEVNWRRRGPVDIEQCSLHLCGHPYLAANRGAIRPAVAQGPPSPTQRAREWELGHYCAYQSRWPDTASCLPSPAVRNSLPEPPDSPPLPSPACRGGRWCRAGRRGRPGRSGSPIPACCRRWRRWGWFRQAAAQVGRITAGRKLVTLDDMARPSTTRNCPGSPRSCPPKPPTK
jgi:hypothetical protein